jgi:hypothetical protein
MPLCCNSLLGVQPTCLAILTLHSSVPTKSDILPPESLLKKRKSQEKERENRAADLEKKRAVSNTSAQEEGSIVMIATTKSTRPQADVVAYVNHLSGLIWTIILPHTIPSVKQLHS